MSRSLAARVLLGVLLAASLQGTAAWAQDTKPPVVTDADRWAAAEVTAITDTDPVGRLNQLLVAARLSQAALFVLAGSNPGIVEQVVDPKYQAAVAVIDALPPPELHRIRRGETVIRTNDILRGRERDRAIVLAEQFEFAKFDEKKLGAIRIGPLEGRYYRVEVTYQAKKKKTLYGSIELAWPSTPERDEETRNQLRANPGVAQRRRHGQRPGRVPVSQGSFEAPDSLDAAWFVGDGPSFPPGTPRGDVNLDDSTALDGTRSLRFHNNAQTRLFPTVLQRVDIVGGTRVRVRCQFRANNLRVEYLQREDQVGMSLQWLDANGQALGAPLQAIGRLSTHPWELLEIESTAPADATAATLQLMSPVPGTAWFDGVNIERL